MQNRSEFEFVLSIFGETDGNLERELGELANIISCFDLLSGDFFKVTHGLAHAEKYIPEYRPELLRALPCLVHDNLALVKEVAVGAIGPVGALRCIELPEGSHCQVHCGETVVVLGRRVGEREVVGTKFFPRSDP